MRNIDPSHIRTFLLVVEIKNVTKASRLLNISQAAASQQIMKLEEILGIALFERTKRGLYPTPAAMRIHAQAKMFISVNDEIFKIASPENYGGEVRIGCPDDVVGRFLPSIFQNYSALYPNVKISLVCMTSPELHDALDARKLDLIITTEDAPTTANATLLLTDRLVFVGAKDGRAFEQKPLPVSIGSSAYGLRNATINSLQDAGINWRAVSEVDHIEVISAFVESDIAIAPLLRSTVPPSFNILGAEHGLPALPDFKVLLYSNPESHGFETSALKHQIVEHFFGSYSN